MNLSDALAAWVAQKGPDVDDPVVEAFVDAAKELLTIREAGALIITPDEALVERVAEVIYQQVELHGVTYDRVAQAVLDALRDAMPDGLPTDPRDLLTDDDREALQSDLNRLAKNRRFVDMENCDFDD